MPEPLGDRERVAYYVAGLIAVFVLAFFAGRVVGPDLEQPGQQPHGSDHDQMSAPALGWAR